MDARRSCSARPRLKAPGEGNRGQRGLGYGDFTERAGAAVSKLRRLFVARCGGQREAASRASSGKLLSGAAFGGRMDARRSCSARPASESPRGRKPRAAGVGYGDLAGAGSRGYERHSACVRCSRQRPPRSELQKPAARELTYRRRVTVRHARTKGSRARR